MNLNSYRGPTAQYSRHNHPFLSGVSLADDFISSRLINGILNDLEGLEDGMDASVDGLRIVGPIHEAYQVINSTVAFLLEGVHKISPLDLQ